MKVAVISDIHNEEEKLQTALKAAAKAGCTVLCCAGDIDEVSTLHLLGRMWSGPLHLVFGNNEEELAEHLSVAKLYPQICHHEFCGIFSLGNRRVAMAHYQMRAERAAELDPEVTVLFYGHTHRADQSRKDGLLLVNPGEICGFYYKHPSFAVYDTEAHAVEFIRL